MDIDAYLEALASAAPVPGGGSAAALSIALAASLVAMTARITRANASYVPRYALADALIAECDAQRAEARAARIADETAYGKVVAATALPKTSPPERVARSAALQAALAGAAAAPLAAADLAVRVVLAAERAFELGNEALATDLGCAAELAAAGLAAAALNVRVNHRYLKDAAVVSAQAAELARHHALAAAALTRVRSAMTTAFSD